MTIDTDLLNGMKKISKILMIRNGSVLEKELEKYATTERKNIGVLIDGKQKSEDIVKDIGKTKRSVDMFLDTLEDAELTDERKYGISPTCRLDYAPSEWISLMPKQSEGSKSTDETHLEDEQHG